MGKVHIIFNPNKPYWHVGETVSGSITYTRKKTWVDVCGIYLTLSVNESVQETGKNEFHFQEYFTKTWMIWGPPNGVISSFTVNAGTHSWPFSFEIPTGLPPSCSHPQGRARITYELKVQAEVPQYPEQLGIVQIVVLPLYQTAPSVMLPVSFSDHETFSRSKGSLSITCSLDDKIVSFGDTVDISVNLNNRSNKVVDYLLISLIQHWKIIHCKEETNVVKGYTYNTNFPIKPSGTYAGKIRIQLPTTVPPSLRGTFFSLDYSILVQCQIMNKSHLHVDMPIIVIFSRPKHQSQSAHQSLQIQPQTQLQTQTQPSIVYAINIPITIGQSPAAASAQQPLKVNPNTQQPKQSKYPAEKSILQPQQNYSLLPENPFYTPKQENAIFAVDPSSQNMNPNFLNQIQPIPQGPTAYASIPSRNDSKFPASISENVNAIVQPAPSAPPLSDSSIPKPRDLKEGWLMHQGRTLKIWKYYYCVLDRKSRRFMYFKSRTDESPKGTIVLQDIISVNRSEDKKSPPNTFSILTRNHTYVFSASSLEELVDWMEEFRTQMHLQ